MRQCFSPRRGHLLCVPTNLVLIWVIVTWTILTAQAADVLSSRNDAARTGANLQETTLTVANVVPGRFGRLYAYAVDGNVYAQPLLVTGVQTALGLRDILYVVTTNNFVYAFYANGVAENGGLIWSRRFGNPLQVPQNLGTILRIPYGPGVPVPVGASEASAPIPWNDPVHFAGGGTTFEGNIGIVGTPVIDCRRKAIYLIARSKEAGQYVQTLHALDLGAGTELPHSPHEIVREGSPVGFAALQNQRAGLAMVMDRVVVAWSGPGGREATQIVVNGQKGPYYGYVMAFDADTLAEVGCFTTGSQGHVMAGIWQSGRAPVIDADGFVYYFTGNGDPIEAAAQPPTNHCNAEQPSTFPPSRNLTNSLVKLDVRNGLAMNWAVADPAKTLLDTCDLDLGGSGPMLVPGSTLMFGGGKQGVLHVLAPDGTGHMQFVSSQQVYDGPPEDFGGPTGDRTKNPCKVHGMHHIMSGPTYWESGSLGPIVYVSVEDDFIRAFKLNKATARLAAAPFSRSAAFLYLHPAAILSLSANGNRSGTGILWAVHSDRTSETMPGGSPYADPVRGILRAFDAEDLSHELWNSDATPSDGFGNFAKFTPVTVANGRVYVPTFSGQVVVYGLLGSGR